MPEDRSDTAFFSRAKTKFAIRELSEARSLNLLVGAGTSVEAGLPNWESLVDGLLIEVANREGIDEPRQRKAFSDHIRLSYGNLTGASVAQGSLGRDGLVGAVRNTLYRGARFHAQPGLLAKHIAILLVTRGTVTAATTNYDNLLELAIDGLGIGVKAIAKVDPSTHSGGEVPVTHLHGYLPPEAQLQGDLILGERDYIEMQAGSSWQEQYIRRNLSGGTCLFVGSSLSDPNLVRYLYLSEPETGDPRHWAIFVRQQDTVLPELPGSVGARVNEHLEHRLMEMGVRRIVSDFYGQVAQFMFELVLRRLMGAAKYEDGLRYGQRLDSWRSAIEGLGIRRGDQESFMSMQRQMHDRLRALRAFATDLALLVSDEPEDFGAHLWVRNPHQRTMELWANSAYLLDDEPAMLEVPIACPSPYQAIETFCYGTPSMRAYSKPGSRWRHSMAQPIYIGTAPWYHIPVGVITLASAHDESESSLRKLPAQQLERLWRELRTVGSEILTPTAGK